MTLERSPLDAVHRALGARMVPFGGWEMPLEYPAGTIDEHLACRSDAVVFDVSHLGTSASTAPTPSTRCRRRSPTTSARSRRAGRSTPTCSTTPTPPCSTTSSCGGTAERRCLRRDAQRLEHRPGARRHRRRGDDARARRARRAGPGGHRAARRRVPRGRRRRALPCRRGRLGRRAVHRRRHRATRASAASRSPCRPTMPATLWEAIVGAGIAPAGLGARDTLRLEAGLPLHGHELGPGITSLQAGLGLGRGVGQAGVPRARRGARRARRRRVDRHLVGIATEGRRPPRADCAVLVDGETVGVVTSGNFSPVLGHGIALALPAAGRQRGHRGERRRARQRPARHRSCRRRSSAADRSAASSPRPSSSPAALRFGRRLLRRVPSSAGAFFAGLGAGAGGGGAGARRRRGRRRPAGQCRGADAEQPAGLLGDLGQRRQPPGQLVDDVDELAEVGRHRTQHRRVEGVGQAGQAPARPGRSAPTGAWTSRRPASPCG